MENLKDFMLLFRMDIPVEQPTPQQIGEMQHRSQLVTRVQSLHTMSKLQFNC